MSRVSTRYPTRGPAEQPAQQPGEDPVEQAAEETDEGTVEDLVEAAVAAAAVAVRDGELVVLPTDTVYGIGADAFDADAVTALLDAKGRGREMPPPVLVSAAGTIDALAVQVPGWARALVDAFWPGGLTLVCRQQSSLQWDLGETRGTVAIRMPDHEVALALLERTGPLAVSSANATGLPAATTADAAEEMLGESVAVLVDDGPSPGGVASTIVDATGERPRVLREGAVSLDDLRGVLEPLGAVLDGDESEDAEPEDEPEDAEPEDAEPEGPEPEGPDPDEPTASETPGADGEVERPDRPES